jgi:hypothetical protein
VKAQLHPFLTLAPEVSAEIHTLATLPPAPIEWEAGLAPELVWMLWKDLLPLPEIKCCSLDVQPIT